MATGGTHRFSPDQRLATPTCQNTEMVFRLAGIYLAGKSNLAWYFRVHVALSDAIAEQHADV